MKSKPSILLFFGLIFCCLSFVSGQSHPPLYIHFVTHNEPNEQLQIPLNYTLAKNNLLEMARLVDSAGMKWNLQTSDGLVMGALTDQSSTSTNIFRTLESAPYSDNVEIDPRYKNMGGRNIADQWYLLDSLGANPTYHLGGCIYSTTNPSVQPIDWEQYRNPVVGNIYGNSWQCTMLTGAGSYPPHTNDLNDFGVFKPDTANQFYQHNPNRNLWCMGVGCAPILTDTTNVQEIIDQIQGHLDSIQSGIWPSDKFYVMRIMSNQRDFNPAFFANLRILMDSLAVIPVTQLKWATIGETFNDFEAWQISTSKDHSQWLCGQSMPAGESESIEQMHWHIFPNPTADQLTIQAPDSRSKTIRLLNASGQVLREFQVEGTTVFSASELPSGIYWLMTDDFVRIPWIKSAW